MKALRFLLSVLIALVLPSRMMAQEAYAVLDGNTLTFYYDNQRATHAEAYLLNTIGNDPGWYASRESVVKVVFHPSFADARPTNTYRWFSGMICLQEIQHLTLYKIIPNLKHMLQRKYRELGTRFLTKNYFDMEIFQISLSNNPKEY